MDRLFPFGFPAATAFYLVCYVITLVIHVLFMNYVFAGTGYVALVSLFPGGPDVRRQRSPLALVLRDWLPFGLSAAITAGVAPLLFVQILYQTRFYTANLLLFHRWMAILPALIFGFYMLYLLKSKMVGDWPAVVRSVVGCGAFAAILFTGYSWTENHLLSLDASRWASLYESRQMHYWSPGLWPRLALWLLGSIPTMAVIAGWQLYAAEQRGQAEAAAEAQRLSKLALAGLLLTAICGAVYGVVAGPDRRGNVVGWLAGPYFLLALTGLALQTAAWWRQRRHSGFSRGCLMAASCGVLLTLLGVTVVRESVRLSQVDLAVLAEVHAQAADRGGLWVFLLFFLINAVLVAAALRMVRRSLRRPSVQPPQPGVSV